MNQVKDRIYQVQIFENSVKGDHFKRKLGRLDKKKYVLKHSSMAYTVLTICSKWKQLVINPALFSGNMSARLTQLPFFSSKMLFENNKHRPGLKLQ